MNLSQQIFLVFFAIFWGTAANAWPKRKPFHWPFFFYSLRVCARAVWSVLMLNVGPVFYFGWVLMQLGRAAAHPIVVWCDVVAGVTPAFGIFGIYRIWIAGTEFRPSWFYYRDTAEQAQRKPDLESADPTIEELYPRRVDEPAVRRNLHRRRLHGRAPRFYVWSVDQAHWQRALLWDFGHDLERPPVTCIIAGKANV